MTSLSPANEAGLAGRSRGRRDEGKWCALLLPFALASGYFWYGSSSLQHRLATGFSLGLILPNKLMHDQIESGKTEWKIFALYSLLTAPFFANYVDTDDVALFGIVSFMCSFSFPFFFKKMLLSFRDSFTVGECSILCQGIYIFVYISLANLLLELSDLTTVEGTLDVILQIGLLGAVIICVTPNVPYLSWFLYPAFFYPLIWCTFFGFILPVLYFNMRTNPIFWLVKFVFKDLRSFFLILYWIYCILKALNMVLRQNELGIQADTVTRKYFHLLILAVYIPGMIWEPNLLFLASGLALALFVLVEFVRFNKIEPFHIWIDDYLKIFLDEKDRGSLILTNIYLLVGCSIPLYLFPRPLEGQFPLWSGILALGIGDSAASVGGTYFGRHRWPGTSKTIEGTLSSVLFQSVFVLLLNLVGVFHLTSVQSLKVVTTFIITSVIEAKTSQIDNLILPLIQYSLSFLAID